MAFLYCCTGREITAHLPPLFSPLTVRLTCQTFCVVVSIDVRDLKEPAPRVLADMGAPVWTTGLGSSASALTASLANSVRNVSNTPLKCLFIAEVALAKEYSIMIIYDPPLMSHQTAPCSLI